MSMVEIMVKELIEPVNSLIRVLKFMVIFTIH
ncbi:hypothetical protein AmaxDRAFT_0066 [Limnospira maxima CS-328]|uniref:Uncharacterized protein n=1 Tax=Limnospira maxima CS-328 TaxID=513049 RepID=B5VU22_LIMMA|nr:hypothetical protein AmaxDRAFT_0066 [Limnospira maxima CS-328]